MVEKLKNIASEIPQSVLFRQVIEHCVKAKDKMIGMVKGGPNMVNSVPMTPEQIARQDCQQAAAWKAAFFAGIGALILGWASCFGIYALQAPMQQAAMQGAVMQATIALQAANGDFKDRYPVPLDADPNKNTDGKK